MDKKDIQERVGKFLPRIHRNSKTLIYTMDEFYSIYLDILSLNGEQKANEVTKKLLLSFMADPLTSLGIIVDLLESCSNTSLLDYILKHFDNENDKNQEEQLFLACRAVKSSNECNMKVISEMFEEYK